MKQSLLRIAFAAACGLAIVTTARAAEDDLWGAGRGYEVGVQGRGPAPTSLRRPIMRGARTPRCS